jgi:hypothetical protein
MMRSQIRKCDPDATEATLQKIEEDYQFLKEELALVFSEAGLEGCEDAQQAVMGHSK